MAEQKDFPYNFTLRSFTYNGLAYKVAITPELCSDEDDLDFTGNYCVMMISELKGTMMFELSVDQHKRWESEPRGIDPGIIDKLDQIIQESRKGIN